MKKVQLLVSVAIMAMLSMTSCVTTCVDNIRAERRLPLSSYVLNLKEYYSGVVNNTVIDIEFTQGDTMFAELACPDEVMDFVMFSVADDILYVNLSDKLSNEEREQISRDLRHSKLFLTSPHLDNVRVNGSSVFTITNDLLAKHLTASVYGSGDVVFKGVNVGSGTINAVVVGSGDIAFHSETKAKSAFLQVNGSGDIDCSSLVAQSVTAQVNGSGDIKIPEMMTETAEFNLSGSGDLVALKMKATTVNATLVGSGDMKLEGSCQTASLSLSSSGDLIARNLEAQDVTASVVGSGDLSCHAQEKLTAKVRGSGDIRYKGNPDITYKSKSDNIRPF